MLDTATKTWPQLFKCPGVKDDKSHPSSFVAIGPYVFYFTATQMTGILITNPSATKTYTFDTTLNRPKVIEQSGAGYSFQILYFDSGGKIHLVKFTSSLRVCGFDLTLSDITIETKVSTDFGSVIQNSLLLKSGSGTGSATMVGGPSLYTDDHLRTKATNCGAVPLT